VSLATCKPERTEKPFVEVVDRSQRYALIEEKMKE
jgi:hypothetical protein